VIGRGHANWVASQRATQAAVAATNHGAFTPDEMRSVETRTDAVRGDMNAPVSMSINNSLRPAGGCVLYRLELLHDTRAVHERRRVS